jgi:cytochrome c peroxidase
MSRTLMAMLAASAAAIAVPGAHADEVMKQAQELFQPIPVEAPAVDGLKVTADKIALGKMLYFEPRLSEAHNISCNSCHQVGLGGVDARSNSIGHSWQHGGRNAPTVLNAVFNTAQFWDGRAADLKEQAGGPIANPIEMGITKEHAVEQLKSIPGYVEAFKQAYPGAADPITYANIEEAIAAFETTLITPNAPFDKYLKGDADALSAVQKEGLALFIEKGCSTCHNGINVGGGMYAPFGVVQKPGAEILPPDDKGRIVVTKTADDEYVFKVPTLRNIELTGPYFHSGASWDLKQAVAVMGSAQLGAELSAEEADKISAFLLTLTGEQPQVTYPILPPNVAGALRPAS